MNEEQGLIMLEVSKGRRGDFHAHVQDVEVCVEEIRFKG